MTCKEISNILSEYYDGELDAATRKRVEEHLVSCKECANELEILKELSGLIRTQVQLEIPADFKDTLSRKLHQAAAEKSNRMAAPQRVKRWFTDWRTTSGLAACLVLLVVMVASNAGLKPAPRDADTKVGQTTGSGSRYEDKTGGVPTNGVLTPGENQNGTPGQVTGLPQNTAAPGQNQTGETDRTPSAAQDNGQQPTPYNQQIADVPLPPAENNSEATLPQTDGAQGAPSLKVASESPTDSFQPVSVPQPSTPMPTSTPAPPVSTQPVGIAASPTADPSASATFPAPAASPPPTATPDPGSGSSRAEVTAAGTGKTGGGSSGDASYATSAPGANTYVMRITRFRVPDLAAAGDILSKYGRSTSSADRSRMFEIANANYQKAYSELASLKGASFLGEENIDNTPRYNSAWNQLQEANQNGSDGSALEEELAGIENLNNVRYIEIVL